MARKLRVEYPGAIYHVMNRGDRREPIFKDDGDRQRLVETLNRAASKKQIPISSKTVLDARRRRRRIAKNEPDAKAILPEPRSVKKQIPISCL